MLQAHSFSGWEARLSRRMCVEGGTGIEHILPLLTICPAMEKEDGLEGPHVHGLQTCSLELQLSLKLSDYLLEPPRPCLGLTSQSTERGHSLWVTNWAPRRNAAP